MNKIHLYNTENILEIPNTQKINITELSKLENDSVDFIYMQDILDTIFPEDHDSVLQICGEKIKEDGFISIQAPDLKQLAIAITLDQINTDIAQMILYKDRVFVHTAQNIKDIVESNKLTVHSQKYINIFEYYFILTK